MIVNSKKLINFLNKIYANGNMQEVVLYKTENGITASCLSEDQVRLVDATLNKNAFMSFDNETYSLGIDNINALMRILGLFQENVEIVRKDNLLLLSSKDTRAKYALMDEEMITTSKKAPEINFNEKIELSKEYFDKICSIIDVLKATSTMKFSNKEGNFTTLIKKGKENEITENFITNSKYEFSAEFSIVLKDIFSTFDASTISCYFLQDKPVMFLEETPEFIIKNYSAPIVRSD